MQKYNCHFIAEKIREGGQLIDVRSQVEFNQGALDGAINIPITSVQSLKDNIKKSKPILLYCRTGARSEMVKNYLEQLGFDQVHNIGGILQFSGC
jgi:phage shock protein E